MKRFTIFFSLALSLLFWLAPLAAQSFDPQEAQLGSSVQYEYCYIGGCSLRTDAPSPIAMWVHLFDRRNSRTIQWDSLMVRRNGSEMFRQAWANDQSGVIVKDKNVKFGQLYVYDYYFLIGHVWYGPWGMAKISQLETPKLVGTSKGDSVRWTWTRPGLADQFLIYETQPNPQRPPTRTIKDTSFVSKSKRLWVVATGNDLQYAASGFSATAQGSEGFEITNPKRGSTVPGSTVKICWTPYSGKYSILVDGVMVVRDTSATEVTLTFTRGRHDIVVNGKTFSGGKWLLLSDSTFIFVTLKTDTAGKIPVIAQEFILAQNYPNPFNPETEIRFGLPKDSHVTIKLFSITGAEVRTLVDADYSAGTHTFSFHARNLPSGTYFYVMQAGTARQVRQLTLLK